MCLCLSMHAHGFSKCTGYSQQDVYDIECYYLFTVHVRRSSPVLFVYCNLHECCEKVGATTADTCVWSVGMLLQYGFYSVALVKLKVKALSKLRWFEIGLNHSKTKHFIALL